MNTFTSQKGQALILLAFGIVTLIGFTALAIDGGRIYSDRRHAQNAADTAALAAGLAYIHKDPAGFNTKGLARAISNGYDNDTDSTVEVHLCNEAGITCTLPDGADPSQYIVVQITSIVPMTFGRVLGRDHVTNYVEAIVRVQDSETDPLHGGAAMVSLKQDDTAFKMHGNGTLKVENSGIFSNSSQTGCPNGSMKFTGSIDVTVETSIQSAAGGDICKTGGNTLGGEVNESGSQLPYPPKNYDVPPPTFTCSGTGQVIGNVITPGNHPGMNLSGDYTFQPGNHCFSGTLKTTGGSITANDVNFKIVSGGFDINGGTFNCSNMLVYGAGGSGVKFNGNGTVNCTGTTFYMASGGVTFNGNFTNNVSAPTSGPYKGLLVYLPYGNSSPVMISGNSGSAFTGSVIGISSDISVEGNSDNIGYHTMIIGYTIDYGGNANATIEFIADEQYIPPAWPTMEFEK